MRTGVRESQRGPLGQRGTINICPVEIAVEGVRYTFEVRRRGPGVPPSHRLGDQTYVEARRQPDGTIVVTVGRSVMKGFGAEVALGLRLRLKGIVTTRAADALRPLRALVGS